VRIYLFNQEVPAHIMTVYPSYYYKLRFGSFINISYKKGCGYEVIGIYQLKGMWFTDKIRASKRKLKIKVQGVPTSFVNALNFVDRLFIKYAMGR